MNRNISLSNILEDLQTLEVGDEEEMLVYQLCRLAGVPCESSTIEEFCEMYKMMEM